MRIGRFAGGGRRWRPLLLAGSALFLPTPAAAQQTEQPQSAPQQGRIGAQQLRDFQLAPQQRLVTQPATPQQPAATPPPAAQRPTAERQPAAEPPRAAAPVQRVPARPTATAPTSQPGTAPAAASPAAAAPLDTAAPLPAAVTEAPAPVAAPVDDAPAPVSDNSPPLWLLLLGGIGLGVGAYAVLRRRSRPPLALPAPAGASATPAAPREPRPDPVPRAWIEVELRPERTTADPAESVVEFEMTVRNSGGSTAKNIKLQAKLICSTPEQDKEISAFQRKKPGEHRTLSVPDIPAGQEIKLKGRVDAKDDELKAMRVEQRLLFVPLVAVNAFYDWGTVRTGQTSKSFLVGRERTDSPAKMAPFRLDLGPRVYRTLGQRPYKVERRV